MIAVVGGGITGLALGYELQRLGADFVVLEASDRPGGVIRSARVDGRILEWGPQRTRLTAGVGELVRDLGIEDEIVTAPADLDLFVYRAGRLRKVPFGALDFVRSDIVGWPAKLRLLWEPFTAGPDPRERVARFFTRKVGREVYETLVAPLYGGLYASDPADMVVGLSLGHVLREFGIRRSLLLPLIRRGGSITPPAPLSFREGMQTLPDALARALGADLRLQSPVHGLSRHGDDWTVELDEGTVEAEHVVLTAPAPSVAGLLDDVAPDAAAALRTLVYNPLAVVHLDADTPLRGLGFQVAFTEVDLALRGVTFNDSLFGRKNVYTAYLGGARHPEVTTMDDDALAALAVDEFRRCTGYEGRPLAVEREAMPAWDASWSALKGLTLPEGLHVAANWASRPGIPGRLAEARRTAQRLSGERAGVR
ncbi:MAG: protoporphyrinogen oxidase [Gemmatimonadota bacterium]|jgi:oxygen-dependent protoporphyrinogen oxidase